MTEKMDSSKILEKWVSLARDCTKSAVATLVRAADMPAGYKRDEIEAIAVHVFLNGVAMAVRLQAEGCDLREVLQTELGERVKLQHLGTIPGGQRTEGN